jgi:hypothetical protein
MASNCCLLCNNSAEVESIPNKWGVYIYTCPYCKSYELSLEFIQYLKGDYSVKTHFEIMKNKIRNYVIKENGQENIPILNRQLVEYFWK